MAGSLEHVRLLPENGPACTEALTAIELADWVILGPGSWYTSVLPHLLLPEMREALCDTAGPALPHHEPGHGHQGNRPACPPRTTCDVLRRYAPEFTVDVVLADPASVPDVPDVREGGGDDRCRGGLG